MTLALISFAVVAALELMIWFPVLWPHRRQLAVINIGLSIITTLAVLVLIPSYWLFIFVVFTLYRLINQYRILKGRTNPDHLLGVSRRASFILIILQILLLLLVLSGGVNAMPSRYFWIVLAALQCLIAAGIWLMTRRRIAGLKRAGNSETLTHKQMPTITVAIPARNETTDLEECLATLVASDYPKLEILVLDDCSQDKRTPEIIRKFAHDGVRFISGSEPPEKWLAKNYAYEQLAEQANGELLLFCGVDVRFEPHTISHIVSCMYGEKLAMASFMPVNAPLPGRDLAKLLVQPTRYAWEIMLPRLSAFPPVLSSCWVIRKDSLKQDGGFAAVTRSSIPERYFARETHARRAYRLLRDSEFGLISVKNIEEQYDTAIRTRYPQLHRRPELVALTCLAEAILLVLPIFMILGGLVFRTWFVVILSVLTYAFLAVSFSSILELAYGVRLPAGLALLPLAAIYDMGMLNYSLWKYEFGEVYWKGRNVCIPVMHVATPIPALPKLD